MLVPWGFVLHYGARLAAAALFGPHMLFVGRHVDRERQRAKAELRAYIDADEDGRRGILAAYKATLMEAARDRVAKAQLKLSSRSRAELERVNFLERQRFVFINKNSPGNGTIKYAAAADPARSSARPLVVVPPDGAAADEEEGEDAAVDERPPVTASKRRQTTAQEAWGRFV